MGWLDQIKAGMNGPTMLGSPDPNSAPIPQYREAWAEVDLAAVRHNVRTLRALVAPASGVCAVVKADGYGHGAVDVARAAIAAQAIGLAVALVEEAVELRQAGISAPILLLSEPPPDAMEAAVAAGIHPTIYSPGGVEQAARAARKLGVRLNLHMKVDTGMHRVGADPSQALPLMASINDDPALHLEGLWTHLAVADGTTAEDRSYTTEQLDRFDRVVAEAGAEGNRPAVLHAANSAGAIAWPEARYNMVRTGLSIYGLSPDPLRSDPAAVAALAAAGGLHPVLSLKARVASVRELDAGERPSYGRLRALPARSMVATIPLGYADGVPRGLFHGGFEVLIRGRRRPLAGMVTMDQIVVDCGPESTVAAGDEVVLLGRQGDDEITAHEWAHCLGTISYEVLCGIGSRVPRITSGDNTKATEVPYSPPNVT